MTNPIFVMRRGVPCTAEYRRLRPRQFPRLSKRSEEILSRNLLTKRSVMNVDGLQKRHRFCSAVIPGSRFTFSRAAPSARAIATRVVIAPRQSTSSRRSYVPSTVGNGYLQSWKAINRNGGAIYNAPAASSLNSMQSTWGKA